MSAESQLAELIDELSPEIQEIVRGCRARLRAQFPDAVLVVHASDGGLTIDFGPDPVPAHAVLRLEAGSDAVHLHLLQHDDEAVTLTSTDDLASDDVVGRIREHLGRVVVLMEASEKGDVIIR